MLHLGKLEKFIVRRVLIILSILGILELVFIRNRWSVLAGLIVGSLLGVIRFLLMGHTISRFLTERKKSPGILIILRYALSQMLLIFALIVSAKINIWLFAGVSTGSVIVPCIVMFNGITEGTGMTHNNFE